MIVYLAQKYFINSFVFFIGLTILPLSFFEDTTHLIAKTTFLGSLFGGIYTVYDFKERHLWPLYDNLIYPKYLLLITFFISLQILSIIINVIF